MVYANDWMNARESTGVSIVAEIFRIIDFEVMLF